MSRAPAPPPARAAAVLASIALCAACKDKAAPPAPPAPGSGAAPDAAPAADWTRACEAALGGAQQLTPVRRIQAILDGCRPCGDWAPLLRWSTLAADGGPRTADIEAAMVACSAYCKPEAMTTFLGHLEASRGKRAPKPWRELGEVCREAVSAVPDVRYMSAPYFALDRIARAAGAAPKLAPLLAAIDLPLPPLSATGGAFVLPASPVMHPDAGPIHVTVSTTEITVGTLPRAKLTPAGVAVQAGPAPYPGTSVAPKALAAALGPLVEAAPGTRIALIAPKQMAARRLLEVIAAAGPHSFVLAAAAAGAPEGWSLPGVVPVALTAAGEEPGAKLALGADPDVALRALKDLPASQLAAPPEIALADQATVEGLAKLLGMLAYRDVAAVRLRRARP